MGRFIEDDSNEEDVRTPKKTASRDDFQDDPPAQTKRRTVIEEDDAPKRSSKRVVVEDDVESKSKEEDDTPVGLDVDFGDERIGYRKAKLPRLTLKDTKVARFALIPGFKIKAAETHFIDKQGTFICLSDDKDEAVCCKKLNGEQQTRRTLRALALVVQYTNAKRDGTMPKLKDGSVDIEWEIKYIRMSRKNYNDIFGLKTEDESVYDFDITMSENDTGIGFKFQKISKSAWWRQDPELSAEILECAEQFRDGKDLARGLGRKIDELEYKALLRKVEKSAKKDEEEEF